jgi:hypothetical protein
VAIACTGVTITWDSTDFQEVSALRITPPGALTIGRLVSWSLDRGTIEIECFGTANISTSEVGERKPLQITGGGLNFNIDCVYQSFSVQQTVSDVTRFGVVLKVMDTLNAGQYPPAS